MRKTAVLCSVFALIMCFLAMWDNEASAESAKADQIVYITKYGEKYHRKYCRTIARSKNVYEITLLSAEKRGYLPCKVCRPQQAEFKPNIKPTRYQAVCVEVIDGDTIRVMTADNVLETVRLYGIDCPEKGQDYGTLAALETEKLILNREVLVEVLDTDKYGRSVALVSAMNSSLQHELVKKGLTWVYPKYCRIALCEELYALETQAQKAQAGLWSGQGIAPWQWRKMN